MNPSDNPEFDLEQLRGLVSQAHAVVESLDALAEQAQSADSRTWALVHVEQARYRWQDIATGLVAGEPAALSGNIRSIVGISIPLDEAPTDLWAGAARTRELCEALTIVYQRFFAPLIGANGLRPGAAARLRELMPQVGTGT